MKAVPILVTRDVAQLVHVLKAFNQVDKLKYYTDRHFLFIFFIFHTLLN